MDNDLFRGQWYPPVEQLELGVSFYALRWRQEHVRRISVY